MRFFEYISRHYPVFFALEIVYIIVSAIICHNYYYYDEWLFYVLMLPLNLVSWPVAFASKKNWHIWQPKYIRGNTEFAFIIALFSAFMPLLYVFFCL